MSPTALGEKPTATENGSLPGGWVSVHLDSIADLESGGTPSKSRPEWWTGRIPWASPKDMKKFRLSDTRDHISEEGLRNGSRLAPAKSIFVVVRGMILAKDLPVALAEVPMAFNQDMKALVTRPVVDPEYLLYALAARKDALATAISTSAHGTRRMETASLESLLLPLPPKGEQRRIAGVLAKLEAAVEVQDRVARALRELKAATMAKLFREGLRREPSMDTPIGPVPDGWGVTTLGEVCSTINYGTSTRCTEAPHGSPVLRIPNVVHERIQTGDLKYAKLTDSEALKLRLIPGDLLFVRTNGSKDYIGRCAVYEGDPPAALFASYLIRVRLDQGALLPAYVQGYLSSPLGRDQLRAGASSASDGKFNIDTAALKRLLVPRPPFKEQEQIVGIVRALDRRLLAAEQAHRWLVDLFSSALNLLMTGQVRVPPRLIDGQAPARLERKLAPEVTDEIVRRIVEAVAPEKIILFGSGARGEMGPDSDLDLLVVKSCDNRREVARAVRACLRGVAPGRGKDVVVVTPEDVERDRDTIGYIIRPALREGRVLYAA